MSNYRGGNRNSNQDGRMETPLSKNPQSYAGHGWDVNIPAGVRPGTHMNMRADAPGNMPRDVSPSAFDQDDLPETITNPIYVPGYLRTQIGRTVRVEFFVGNQLTDRVGRLLEVGASYILLQELDGASVIMCDLFSIKFVTIMREGASSAYFS